MARVIRIRFINPNGSCSDHGYDFLISPRALDIVRHADKSRWINRHRGGNICTFRIETGDGNHYNDAYVFIEWIKEQDNYRGLKKIVRMSERQDGNQFSVPFSTDDNEFDLSPCDETTPINEDPKPHNKKEEKSMSTPTPNSMMSRLGLTFGKVSDVFFSIYGPAFIDETKDGSVVAYDAAKGEYVDVTDFSTDDSNLCYAIPTPTSQIKAGDFIRNGNEWARVASIKAKGVLILEEIKSRKIIEVMPTKNLWGFSFTTKLVSLMDGMTGGDNPMGNLPMMMMLMDGNDGEDGDNKMLMAMALMGGMNGANGNASNLMQNPMMMAAMMGGKGGKGMMPMLMMSQMMQQQQTPQPAPKATKPKAAPEPPTNPSV